jgi:hypothetical protein
LTIIEIYANIFTMNTTQTPAKTPSRTSQAIQNSLLTVGDRITPLRFNLTDPQLRRIGAGALLSLVLISGAAGRAIDGAAHSTSNEVYSELSHPEPDVLDKYRAGDLDHMDTLRVVTAPKSETAWQYAEQLAPNADPRYLSGILNAQAGQQGIQANTQYVIPK